MKKVIISANVFFTITNFRIELLKALKNEDYEIVCIANNDELSYSSYQILEDLNIKFIQADISRKGLNPIEDLRYLFNLVEIYKKEKADIVLHFTIKPNIYGTIAAKLAGVKSINTINGLGSAIIGGGMLAKVLKLLYKFSLNFSTKIFFQNEDDKSFFLDNKIVNKDKVSIVPGSGVDTKFFNDCDSTSKKLTFLLVARLLKDKGIYEYIEAVKVLKKKYADVEFLLAGQFDDGNPTAIQKFEVEKWGNNGIIKFLGKTDNIKEFLKLTDVVVLPSYREGLSRFLIESACASKPIVTTNVAGCKDVVEDGVNGFLCEAKDSKSLEEAIEKMINLHKNELFKMGENSKKIVTERFDKDIVNNIYLKVIKSL